MASQPKLYKIQEAGGAGRCFFNSIHDSALSRENDFSPKKEILNGIYSCFGISMANYDAKTTQDDKKIQFNRDIRTFLATKIRAEPSGFQEMAKDDFERRYREAQNKEPLEQTRIRGQADINNYPGYFDYVLNQDTYDELTADHELFELQRAGAISSASILQMGRRNFYNLIAKTLEDQNYSTYAMAPTIELLNYYLSKCPMAQDGYTVQIIFSTERNLQAAASPLTLYRYDRDLVMIPVYKTYGAHYQAIVSSTRQTATDPQVQEKLYELELAKSIKPIQEKARKEVDEILADVKMKHPSFTKELEKQEERQNQKQKQIQSKRIRRKSTAVSTPMYIIPQDFFTVGKFYQSVEKVENIPIVEVFEVTKIQPKTPTSYELSITMKDGTKTSILINNKEGHFVRYQEVSETMGKGKENPKANQKANPKENQKANPKDSSPVPKAKTKEEYTDQLKKMLGDEIFEDLSISSTSDSRLPFEEFQKKLTDIGKKLGQKGGSKRMKTRKGKQSRKQRLKRKTSKKTKK